MNIVSLDIKCLIFVIAIHAFSVELDKKLVLSFSLKIITVHFISITKTLTVIFQREQNGTARCSSLKALLLAEGCL